jgi:leucyl/phenylalanyl-tRNA--protein transferase
MQTPVLAIQAFLARGLLTLEAVRRFSLDEVVSSYAKGYFLMADDRGHLGWYSSRQRALIPLDERFRYPTSLQRHLNSGRFEVAIDRDFKSVVEGCAARDETWISDDLKSIYFALHDAGFAHSFETWEGGELAGGILGLVLGAAFIGESMFFRIPEGSKAAMVRLVEHLRAHEFFLFDAQIQNPHLERFGSYIVPEREYLSLLTKAVREKRDFTRLPDGSAPSTTPA